MEQVEALITRNDDRKLNYSSELLSLINVARRCRNELMQKSLISFVAICNLQLSKGKKFTYRYCFAHFKITQRILGTLVKLLQEVGSRRRWKIKNRRSWSTFIITFCVVVRLEHFPQSTETRSQGGKIIITT